MTDAEHKSITTRLAVVASRILRRLAIVALTCVSAYLVWGWLTIVDIQAYCTANKLPLEETLMDLIPIPHESAQLQFTPDKQLLSVSNYHYRVGSLLPIYRYVLPFQQTIKLNIGAKEQTSFECTGAWLLPFLMYTENTRNTLFCFGLGFIVSLFLVGTEHLRGKPVDSRRCLLRPLLGGVAAALLFVFIISGGAMLWQEVDHVRGLSVGIIAVLASLNCERFPQLLRRLTDGALQESGK